MLQEIKWKGKTLNKLKSYEKSEWILHLLKNPIRTKEETEQAIHRNKAKLTRRERLLQKDDQENMINSCPDYINGGIEQINVPKGKKLTLNEKGQSILVDEPRKSLWSRIKTLLSNLLP